MCTIKQVNRPYFLMDCYLGGGGGRNKMGNLGLWISYLISM